MAAVRAMIQAQHHRGPDGSGFVAKNGATFGHARLAIIDLSDAAAQPMCDRTGRFMLSFNGEIYNYIELRRELATLGVRFYSESDSEVLLAAYIMWREKCLERLRGMFAFSIWDDSERVLFAARDRMGIKPFHYWHQDSKLAFSSEIKALLPFVRNRKPNRSLARDYLAWNLLDHVPDETMFESVRRLPAAHWLRWSPEGGVTVHRYWDLVVSDEFRAAPRARKQYAEEFRSRLADSIRLHLRSDVPVGTCLSGGLDSSTIASLINSQLRSNGATAQQHTFTACFVDPSIDERRYVEAVTTDLGCSSHSVFPTGEALRDELRDWLWHQEEPVGSTGMYAQYCVARLARSANVKVLLDGQGADELLAGYRKFILVYIRHAAASGRPLQAIWEVLRFFASIDVVRTTRLSEGRRYLSRAPGVASMLFEEPIETPRALRLGKKLGSRIYADLFNFSLPVLLRYEDRNTMAFGVEGRVPFVDHEFVEWAAQLPAEARLSDGWTKRVLRDGMSDMLPQEVLRRKTKLGFSTPEREWLRGPLHAWLMTTLSEPRHLSDIVRPAAISRLLDEYARHSASVQNVIFRLAIYETWARVFLE